jgi:U3 small nucleolar RNA-associated protein 4
LKGGKGRSVEGLAWIPAPIFQQHAPNRLFSIGSSTYLTEWDVTTGIPKHHLDSNAGAIWSLAGSPDGATIALGCEDGTIILVDVAHGSFNYSRSLERQRSRVLSLSWHPDGKTLVGGCADSTIRAWDVSHPHGRIIAQMKVETLHVRGTKAKRRRKMDTLVWAVEVASDGTVLSGDSTGSLKIWETKFWSLKQSFQVHKGDILCLVIDKVFL